LLSFAGATAPISSDQVAGSLSNQLSWSGALVIHTFCQCNPGSPMDTFLNSEEKIQSRYINVNRILSALHDFPIFVH
jgi:hypothetical protein